MPEKRTKTTDAEKQQARRHRARERQGPAPQYEEEDLLVLQRAVTNPALARPADILALQRTAGNWAVAQMLAEERKRTKAEASTQEVQSGVPEAEEEGRKWEGGEETGRACQDAREHKWGMELVTKGETPSGTVQRLAVRTMRENNWLFQASRDDIIAMVGGPIEEFGSGTTYANQGKVAVVGHGRAGTIQNEMTDEMLDAKEIVEELTQQGKAVSPGTKIYLWSCQAGAEVEGQGPDSSLVAAVKSGIVERNIRNVSVRGVKGKLVTVPGGKKYSTTTDSLEWEHLEQHYQIKHCLRKFESAEKIEIKQEDNWNYLEPGTTIFFSPRDSKKIETKEEVIAEIEWRHENRQWLHPTLVAQMPASGTPFSDPLKEELFKTTLKNFYDDWTADPAFKRMTTKAKGGAVEKR